MTLSEALGLRPGVTAVIGGGGKTTLLRTAGEELAAAGHTVLLCATTKMFPFPGLPNVTEGGAAALAAALAEHRLVCAGRMLPESGKLTAPAIPMAELAELAEYVLVEADGSARRPLKAHLSHEPVIPSEAGQTVCVTGVSGFGLPICEAAHRPERFAELAETVTEAAATPENTALVLAREGLADLWFFNQADTPERWEWALRAAQALRRPAVLGTMQKGAYRRC
ncbi:selenium cofactor biosynthesis protein YqeC [Dysosmobacter sp.]|uniref:selenium cofactor biosynthesis protein YqeC n=1 Tax=Dysosmobacter sp. TaxID=2591382 RepID=UPI002A8D49D4|nr:selenium cofactor biosynthesis protein YqeC [Dysosmobacter sp.]MDY3280948.1 selenium cofactor biosynthesis protein YqeC [Dysosmobacter sp.]